jgi:hypothetical protein
MRDPATIPATVGIHNTTSAYIWLAGYAGIAAGASITLTMGLFDTNALQPPFGPTVKSLVFQAIADVVNQGLVTFTDSTTLTADDDLTGVVTGVDPNVPRPGLPDYHTPNAIPRLVSAVLAALNADVLETFTEGLLHHAAGGPVVAGDFTLTFHQNGGTATSCAIASVKNATGGTLVGGESVIKINLTVGGTPSGVETIVIVPNAAIVGVNTKKPINVAQATPAAILLDT